MADTAIWSTLSWPLANVVSARALIYDLVGIVPAFGPCFACSCDQKVRARLLVSSHRYFYKVDVLLNEGTNRDRHGYITGALHTHVVARYVIVVIAHDLTPA